jgi:large subunit ribosomal protein L5
MNEPFLKKHYKEVVLPELQKALGYKNVHEVPALEKIVLNSGINASRDKNWINDLAKELGLIAGQKPVITRARKSISNFKVRQGMPLGAKVTLRGDRMYDFLYRMLVVALPAIRDFRGIPTKLDGRGNYNLGIEDHTVFPEINVDSNRQSIGMDVTIVTTAKTDNEGRELLKLMGLPFRKPTSSATQAA